MSSQASDAYPSSSKRMHMSSPPFSRTYRPDFESDMVGYDSHNVGRKNQAVRYVRCDVPYWQRNIADCLFGLLITQISLSMLLRFLWLHVQIFDVTSSSAVVPWLGLAIGMTFLSAAITAPIWLDAKNRIATKDGSSAPSHRSVVVALLLAVAMVFLANEPIMAMYVEQLGGWCRRRL